MKIGSLLRRIPKIPTRQHRCNKAERRAQASSRMLHRDTGVSQRAASLTMRARRYDLRWSVRIHQKKGAEEIGFTVLSMSVSLVAVFIPLLLMSGVIGRMFQEFAVTVSSAIAVSALVSLTLTPTMCAYLLKPSSEEKAGRVSRALERVFDAMQSSYETGLIVAR